MVYTPVIELTFRRITVLTFTLVQTRSGSGVEFHQACKGDAFGNVTIKVTRH